MFLVVGANGQLGSELKLQLQGKAVYVDRTELDITDKAAVEAFVAQHQFEAIINCAAYTAVDKAESDEKVAELINVEGPRNLAATGLPLVHISTDYVFDGEGKRPYLEWDLPDPQSIYGASKELGERYAMQFCKKSFIVRTAWLY